MTKAQEKRMNIALQHHFGITNYSNEIDYEFEDWNTDEPRFATIEYEIIECDDTINIEILGYEGDEMNSYQLEDAREYLIELHMD